MRILNQLFHLRLILSILLCLVVSSSALIEKWVGKGETYATISAAIGSLPKPTSEDVRILVTIPPEGWVEDNLDINVTGILSSSAALDIEYVDKSTTTFYIGDDLEYQRSNNQYTVIENYSGSELVSNRTYTIDDAATAQNQYFIKNLLGSTVTLVDKDGKCVAPVYDYFAYGKQIAENTTPQQVTQTFTGKELDLFEKDAATGEDGEGLYYFGKRYYNVDIALWISCDPKHQFWSPYSYTGNGINPVIGYDPDGAKIVFGSPTIKEYYNKYNSSLQKNDPVRKRFEVLDKSVNNYYLFTTKANENRAGYFVTFENGGGAAFFDPTNKSTMIHELAGHGIQAEAYNKIGKNGSDFVNDYNGNIDVRLGAERDAFIISGEGDKWTIPMQMKYSRTDQVYDVKVGAEADFSNKVQK
jgi:RHS repeat-associated protein